MVDKSVYVQVFSSDQFTERRETLGEWLLLMLLIVLLIRFSSQSPRSHSEKNTTLHYPPPVLPKEMTDVSVMVCHINSPSDFYLQLVSI